MVKTHFPILFNLLRGLDKVIDTELSDSASKVGLTLTELHFIWTIFCEDEPSVSRVSELTLLDASTVTQVITRLKKKKLVSSFKKTNDHRFSYVTLTVKGEEKIKQLMMTSELNFLTYLQKELESSEGKEKMKVTLDFLKQINLHFNGEEFVNWVYSLPKKMK